MQGLDRYAYVNNSPMNYVDPSGHICVESDGDSDVGMAGNCHGGSNPKYKPGLQGPKWNPGMGSEKGNKPRIQNPSGNFVEINFLGGLSLEAVGYDGNPTSIGLLYYSFGLVSDNDGNLQFYYSQMDKIYIPGSYGHMGGYLSGVAEAEKPSSGYGLGVTLNRGWVFGDSFTTNDFLGRGYSDSVGLVIGSASKTVPYDRKLDYIGYELGIGLGASSSGSSVATITHGIGDPIDLRKEFGDASLPVCHLFWQCGTYTYLPFP